MELILLFFLFNLQISIFPKNWLQKWMRIKYIYERKYITFHFIVCHFYFNYYLCFSVTLTSLLQVLLNSVFSYLFMGFTLLMCCLLSLLASIVQHIVARCKQEQPDSWHCLQEYLFNIWPLLRPDRRSVIIR